MFFNLLAAVTTDPDSIMDTINTQLLTLFNTYIIPALMTVATVVLVVLGIVNGVHMAKASTEEEKTKAKKNHIGLLAGAVICVAAIWLIPLIIQLALGVFNPANGITPFQPI